MIPITSIEQVIQKAIAFDHGDARRIHHFLKVYAYADTIGRLEGLPADQQDILRTAAVLHDIGIHAAEEKYGSSSGKYQEIEGPAPARAILEELGADEKLIDRVCFLIASPWSFDQLSLLKFRRLWHRQRHFPAQFSCLAPLYP